MLESVVSSVQSPYLSFFSAARIEGRYLAHSTTNALVHLTPWYISTDFPYPRTLEYDVQEGTWLRLDVHPKTGDSIFDMTGDIYCLPANARSSALAASGSPRPSGPARFVYRSDAELGLENIWIREWAGCVQEDLHLKNDQHVPAELRQALDTREEDEDMLVRGVKETMERKKRRLIRAGRLGARRVTNETYNWLSNACFHHSGTKIIATKWYKSGIAAGEGWAFSVPHIDGNGKEFQSVPDPAGDLHTQGDLCHFLQEPHHEKDGNACAFLPRWYEQAPTLTGWQDIGIYVPHLRVASDSSVQQRSRNWYPSRCMSPLTCNRLGERVAPGTPRLVPFTAHIEKRPAETRRSVTDTLKLEMQRTQCIFAFTDLKVNDEGTMATFQAAGVTYVQRVGETQSPAVQKVPVLHPKDAYYSPTFIHGEDNLILHALAYEVRGLSIGRYYSPIVCEFSGRRRKFAFIKTGGDRMTGSAVATAHPGLYVGDITLPSPGSTLESIVVKKNWVIFHPRFNIPYKKNFDLSAGPDEFGDYRHRTLARGRMSTEMITSTEKGGIDSFVAFVEFFHVNFVSTSNFELDELIWIKPGNATKGTIRLSVHGGHDLAWSGNGQRLFWLYGPVLNYIEADKLSRCSTQSPRSDQSFEIPCVQKLVESQELFIDFVTDIQRLKEETVLRKTPDKPRSYEQNHADVLIIANDTILTMETTGRNRRPIRGFVILGFVDVHAHWANPWLAIYPSTSWELQAYLAYGITAVHNPSAQNTLTFNERAFIESGKVVGSRVFHTGTIVYGAGPMDIHQDIVDDAEAYSALARIKAEGGPASFSYKNYELPTRACPLDWDLKYIIDGMTAIEHNLLIPQLFEDILTLFALSGTSATPTHIVNHGGVWDEQLVWATEDIPNDPKLRRFVPHDILQRVTESISRPMNSYALFNTSASIAKMVLRAATSDAAETLGLLPSLGSLMPGKLADFLIYPGIDLLADDSRRTREILYVVRGG
ncbi:hypothetical protein EW146_g6977 [Bondarzewia mesenterica]|uniref:Amidohydrolase-related domain-containing protein n=1 Tax=Bondarzewia mesenterica TaxID=1095465 RepID=A0A4S4LM81_9AGAM|nr:hypothetical protein EW146_g6977 [Bondarzewia mesenterica]